MYEDLTNEELISKLNERDTLIATMQSEAEEASRASTTSEAEINSLKKELEEVNTKFSAQMEELKKTKELNFTLGRQVAKENSALDVEEHLHNIFGSTKKEK